MERPTIDYEVSATPVTLDDLELTGEQQEPGELEEAMGWLREALADGHVGVVAGGVNGGERATRGPCLHAWRGSPGGPV